MTAHVKYIVKKVEDIISAMRKMMPRVNRPRTSKRRVLASVAYSTILYGAPIWKDVIKLKKYREMLINIQKRLLIGVTRAYRTTFPEALQVIGKTIPIDLMVEKRNMTHTCDADEKKKVRPKIIEIWQRRWGELSGKAEWTKKLIPDLRIWLDKKHNNNINFHLCQFLTGHGCFNSYLKRIGKRIEDRCLYCPERDTAEHILVCPRWQTIWEKIEMMTTHKIEATNIIKNMLENEEMWGLITSAITEIMTTKEKDEKRILEDNI